LDRSGTGARHSKDGVKTVEDAAFTLEAERESAILTLTGDWVTGCIKRVDAPLRALKLPQARRVVFDLEAVSTFDTAGAWLVHRTQLSLESGTRKVEITGLAPDRAKLLSVVAANDQPMPPEQPRLPAVLEVLNRIGAGVIALGQDIVSLFSFFGLTLSALAKLALKPHRFRINAFSHTIEQAGLNAVPIVALISFLVGAVIAYQGAAQLRNFNASVLTVDLVAVSVLREIGILLTAILVAGRSGSAYAAEIGAMKVNEEVDAMRTLALDPVEILVLPRILGLVVALPLLNFLGDIAGLAGGCLVAWTDLGITPDLFLTRLHDVVSINHFWVGMIKAPVFGYLIAMIGCYEGFRVEGSAESVGQRTTQSVVEAIFVVIVVDALFSVFFTQVNL
jgi:phospholipid/cholesterol/gamma-HCH transport system permease protein